MRLWRVTKYMHESKRFVGKSRLHIIFFWNLEHLIWSLPRWARRESWAAWVRDRWGIPQPRPLTPIEREIIDRSLAAMREGVTALDRAAAKRGELYAKGEKIKIHVPKGPPA